MHAGLGPNQYPYTEWKSESPSIVPYCVYTAKQLSATIEQYINNDYTCTSLIKKEEKAIAPLTRQIFRLYIAC